MLKNIILMLSLIGAVLIPSVGFAQDTGNGQLTKYPPGTCIDNQNGKWQQLADGTWAPPNDPLNTCATGGIPASWVGNSTYDPWARAGLGNQYPWYERTSQYPWGTNYPGGYENQSDWLTNCVLMQSLVQRPECAAFPRYGTLNSSYYSPWSAFNQDIYLQTQIGDNLTMTARIPFTQKLGSFAQSFLVGWAVNRLMQ
jgi:hypothetical protein